MRFHPFILPSRSFLRIGSLALLETQHGVQGAVVFCACVYMWALVDFLKKLFLPLKRGKYVKNWPEIGFLGVFGIFSHNFFLNLIYNENLLFVVFFHKSHLDGSWVMGKNAYGQSDCRIFKSTIPPEQIDEKALFFASWYRFMEMKIWLKSIGVGIIKSGCRHTGLRTQKLALSQEAINVLNWPLDKNNKICWKKTPK